MHGAAESIVDRTTMTEGSLSLPHAHPPAAGLAEAAAVSPGRPIAAGVSARAAGRTLVYTLLGAILLLGGVLRFTGLDWDQGQHLHPDERFLTMVATALKLPEGDPVAGYFDEARSTLNPRNVGHTFFVYGNFPVLIVKAISVLVDRDGYDEVHLVGRAVDGLVDLWTVVMLFLLARTLYRDDRVALLAGLLYSLSALAIQQAHFFVVESFTVFFVTVALFFMARV